MQRLYHQPTCAQFVPPDPGVLNQYFNFDFFNMFVGMDGCLLLKIQPAKCQTEGTTRSQTWRCMHKPTMKHPSVHCDPY